MLMEMTVFIKDMYIKHTFSNVVFSSINTENRVTTMQLRLKKPTTSSGNYVFGENTLYNI